MGSWMTSVACPGSVRSRPFGITAAIHSTPDYDVTQAWAAAFSQAGFGGVYYRVSHDPSQQLTGIALFGPSGPFGIVVATTVIGPELQREALREFGIQVVPVP